MVVLVFDDERRRPRHSETYLDQFPAVIRTSLTSLIRRPPCNCSCQDWIRSESVEYVQRRRPGFDACRRAGCLWPPAGRLWRGGNERAAGQSGPTKCRPLWPLILLDALWLDAAALLRPAVCSVPPSLLFHCAWFGLTFMILFWSIPGGSATVAPERVSSEISTACWCQPATERKGYGARSPTDVMALRWSSRRWQCFLILLLTLRTSCVSALESMVWYSQKNLNALWTFSRFFPFGLVKLSESNRWLLENFLWIYDVMVQSSDRTSILRLMHLNGTFNVSAFFKNNN